MRVDLACTPAEQNAFELGGSRFSVGKLRAWFCELMMFIVGLTCLFGGGR